MIELKHITKTFNGKKALSDISFSVSEGEIFGFLGPSGSGKTTTINILTGQLVQDSGQAFILGKNSKDISADDLLNIGQPGHLLKPTYFVLYSYKMDFFQLIYLCPLTKL